MTVKEVSRPATTPVAAKPAPLPRRLSPFDLLQTEIDRVFDAFNGWPPAFTERAFSPSMEVVETDNAIEVSTELPGMDEKDVEISVSDNVLTIRGEKKFEKDEKKKNYRLVERSYGSFERSVALPQGCRCIPGQGEDDQGRSQSRSAEAGCGQSSTGEDQRRIVPLGTACRRLACLAGHKTPACASRHSPWREAPALRLI